MTQTEQWIDVEGARLFALERGDGHPILALHGGLADHRAAWLFARDIGGFRVITPDLRGSGRSHFHGPITWTRLADDLAAWLDALGLARALVTGTSFGSGVAVAFALRHPDRVAGLALLQPSHYGTERGRNEAQRQALARMDAAGQRCLDEGIEALIPLFDALPDAIRERAKTMVRGFDPGSVAATTRFLDRGAEPFQSLNDLDRVRAPTVIVPGADPTHPPELARLYAAHIPDARIVAQAMPACAITELAHRVF